MKPVQKISLAIVPGVAALCICHWMVYSNGGEEKHPEASSKASFHIARELATSGHASTVPSTVNSSHGAAGADVIETVTTLPAVPESTSLPTGPARFGTLKPSRQPTSRRTEPAAPVRLTGQGKTVAEGQNAIATVRAMVEKKRFEGLGDGLDTAEGKALQEWIKGYLRSRLHDATSNTVRKFVYRQAFESGIDPETLLVPETPEHRVAVDQVVQEYSQTKNLIEWIRRAEALPDTDYKADRLTKLFVQEKNRALLRAIVGIPSSKTMKTIGDAVISQPSDTQFAGYGLELLRDGYVFEASEQLRRIVEAEPLSARIRVTACVALKKWIFKTNVAKTVYSVLISEYGYDASSVLPILTKRQDGDQLLYNIVENAQSEEVQWQAFRQLEIGGVAGGRRSVFRAIIESKKAPSGIRKRASELVGSADSQPNH